MLLGTCNYLDLTSKGRNESGPMSWVRLHDTYDDSYAAATATVDEGHRGKETDMLYSILIYGDEATIDDWTQQEEETVLSRHADLRQRLTAQSKLGPTMRLMASTTATTLRCGTKPLIVDGPFSETKEQLLGIYVIECAALEEAIEAARALAFDTGVLEIRPIALFRPGGGQK